MKKLIQVNELEKCPCFNLRAMARQITNDYNDALKVSGIIANLLNLESSTIRRNSSVLIKKKFVRIVKRNIKGNLLKLTSKGYKKLKETLPTWRESNTKGKILISNYIDVLKKISK